MRFRAAITLALLATAAAITPIPAAMAQASRSIEIPPLAYTYRMLENGMRVYALRDPSASSAAVYLWYDAGQRDDPKERGGFAHLFEHLMFKPTRNIPEGIFSYVTTISEEASASTLFDHTIYTATVPSNRLETMLWLEGERLRNLIVDDASFRSEREVVKEELRQRILAQPYGRILYTLLPGFVFTRHPYARPIGGTAADLDRASLADVRAFHEAFYRPDNAVMVVAGNFEPTELDRWLDRYLGSVPKPAVPLLARAAVKEPERTTPLTVDAYAPNVPLAALIAAWVSPPGASPDVAGLDIIAALLTKGAAARLNRKLTAERQLASNVSAINLDSRDGHAFAIQVTLAKGANLTAVQTALNAEFQRLRSEPLTATELDRVRNGLLADALAQRETIGGRAMAIGDGVIYANDPALADKRLAAIRDMTPASLQRIAAQWLAANRQVTIRYQDESQRPAGYVGDASIADTKAMGPIVPPATLAPVTAALEGQREQPPAAGLERRTVPTIVGRTLANGLNLVSARSTDLPLTTLELVIPGGTAADPPERAGLASLVAALALRGAGDRDAQALASTADAIGARLSASAQPDATLIRMTAPSANIDAAAQLFSDIVLRPITSPAELAQEKRKQIDALSIAALQPMAAATRAAMTALFSGSPYSANPTAASLDAVTDGDVAAVRRSWTPRGATLIVTGSLDTKVSETLASKMLGSWQGGAPGQAVPRVAIAPGKIVALDLPGAAQTAVLAAIPIGPRGTGDEQALQVANAFVGGGRIGWLSTEIRRKRGLSYVAGSMIERRRGAGYVIALSQTKNESAPEVARLMLAQFARLEDEPLTPEDVTERATFLSHAIGSTVSRTAGLADYLADLVASGAPLSIAREELGPAAKVSPERVKMAAKQLNPSRATLIVAGDAKAWLPDLRAAFPDIEVMRPGER